MLASLFNCPVLSKLENLVVNPSDRFAKYEAIDRKLGLLSMKHPIVNLER